MIHALLVTHGFIGESLIGAVEGITGINDGLHSISVNNKSAGEIADQIQSFIEEISPECNGIIIMASLKGGSCWNVSAAVARNNPKVKILSGINLPMIISFVMNRNVLNFTDLLAKVKESGISGISYFDG